MTENTQIDWLGTIGEIKKYTKQTLVPVKSSLDEMKRNNYQLNLKFENIENENIMLNQKIDHLQNSIDKIL